MTFFKIFLKSQPVIRFACSDTVSIGADSCNIIDHRRGMIELNSNSLAIDICTECESYRTESGDILLLMPDRRYTLSRRDIEHADITMNSVAVSIEGLEFERFDLPPEEAAVLIAETEETDSNIPCIFLPEITRADEAEQSMFAAMFKSVMNHHAAGTPSERLFALASWYEFAALLDMRFRKSVRTEKRDDSGTFYVYKAKKYIFSHITDHLSLDDIASELGITSAYLCTLFKKCTGQTVIDFINRQRCQLIREKLATCTKSISEICDEVGLRDRRYSQRLFKKYYGVSMQRCRQLESGLSRYHENPWMRKTVDHDIYEESCE